MTSSKVASAASITSLSAARSKASKSGAKGESIVSSMHDDLKAQGVAVITKVATPTRRVLQRGTWGLIYTERSIADYAGWRCRDGKHIAIECKRCTTKTRFAMSVVKEHQRDHLDAVARDGGIAMLTVVWGDAVCPMAWAAVRHEVSLSAGFVLAMAVDAKGYARRIGEWGETFSEEREAA